MHHLEVELDLPVTMRDGTVLRADVYRPSGSGPWPVILHRTPYNKRRPGHWLIIDVVAATQRGYMVVHQDTRGRFESDGEWLPWVFEQEDGYDTVEWAAALPGSSGKVGMVGASYVGNVQWNAAIGNPPHLAAIAPLVTFCDPADGLTFRDGALELGVNTWWTVGQSLPQLPKLYEGADLARRTTDLVATADSLVAEGYWGLPSGHLPVLAELGLPDLGVEGVLAGTTDGGECRIAGKHSAVMVPSLNIGGWFDLFQQGTIDNYLAMQASGVPAQLVMGPWDHQTHNGLHAGQTGVVNFGLASVAPGAMGLSDTQLDWFDQWLTDAPADNLTVDPVQIFVMGANIWRTEPAWPLARSVDTPLYLRSDSALSFTAPVESQAYSAYTYDPATPTPTNGGSHWFATEFRPGPADQLRTESRADVLVFTSEVLADDLEVTGRVRAVLHAWTDCPSTDWVVRLCDVDVHGVSRNVVDGILRTPTEPLRSCEYEIDLWSTSMVFKAGHRLRVQITSSNFPRWDRNLNTGESANNATQARVAQQRIYFDTTRPSHLVLPVVPAEA